MYAFYKNNIDEDTSLNNLWNKSASEISNK